MQHLNLYGQLDRAVEPPFSGRHTTWAVMACASIMVVIYGALLVVSTMQHSELETLQQRQAVIANELSTLKQTKAQLEQDETLERKIFNLQNQIGFRRRLLTSIDPNSTALAAGFADHLTGLARQHIDGLWFTEIQLQEGGQKLALLGRTRAPEYVPRYLQRLSSEAVFAGHQFRVFRMSTPAQQKHLLDFELRASDVTEP